MIEPTEKKNPSRALKATAAAASGIFWSLWVAWLCLLVAWSAIHGWIVPRIADFRPRIEVEASRLMGSPVRIGEINASAGWLVPTFALSDVRVLDADGRTALRLPLVVAALSPRSLLHLGFEQLYLEAPELEVRRAADGRIFVAGRPLEPSADSGSRGADWLFSQAEVVVRNGTLRWTDDRAGTPPVALSQVELLLRNGPWRHALRAQATPPAGRGERFTVIGQFSHSLMSMHPGDWRAWRGPVHVDLPGVDLAEAHARLGDILRPSSSSLPAGGAVADQAPPAPLFGLERADGRGDLRAWIDIADGDVGGATLDLDLHDLDLRFAAAPEALQLSRLGGRISGHRDSDGFDLKTQRLALARTDGGAWPGGNFSLTHRRAGPGRVARTELGADRLDLGALAGFARGLPLDAQVQRALSERAPQGLLESLQARWDGAGQDGYPAPRFQARGRVSGLAVAALPADSSRRAAAAAVEAALRAQDPHGHRHAHPPLGQPGIRGADVDFDFDETGGKARLAMRAGALEFPGVFEEPLLPLDTLRAEVRWQRGTDGRLAVQVPQASFANADAAGELHATWHTADEADPARRLPGVLDLGGRLSRADGTRVHRYLPQSIGPEVRHYVRDAISAGVATSAQFKVRGDLRHMPFQDPRQGVFQIGAKLRGVTYAYAPPHIEGEQAQPWPALVRLDGELLFEGVGMRVRNATGRLEAAESMRDTGARGPGAIAPRQASTPALRPGDVQVLRAEAQIPDLAHAVVAVQARARGPLAEMLGIVDATPLAGMTNHALSNASVTGQAELQLGLSLPIAEIRRSTVRGSVMLGGNDLRFGPQMPLLARARGTVNFTETGFTLAGTQARMLGGEVRLEGGMKPAAGGTGHVLSMRAQGSLTAEGLREATELGAVPRLAQSASGGTSYSASFDVTDGKPEVQVSSSLQGLAIDFPAPLGKSADSVLPLDFHTRLLPREGAEPQRDELGMALGEVVAARFLRAIDGPTPRVLAGRLAVGADAARPAPLPAEGVSAQVRLAALDVDAWRALIQRVGEQPKPADAAPAPVTPASERSESADYLPDTLLLRADVLTVAGRTLHQVAIDGSHAGKRWRAEVDARELAGKVEYQQADGKDPGRVFARLSRLQVPDTAAQDVESLTDGRESAGAAEAASARPLPALDIVVDDFQLKDRRLGRVEVQAVNRDAEWRLDKLQLSLPEAVLSAKGRWGRRAPGTARRTELDFRLDLKDSGALLGRFGMPGVIARGSGTLKGNLDWPGSPFGPDYTAMDGALRLDVASGQFLKADPGLAKLLGVLSLQSLPRRLTLDFRDVFSEGFAFDHVRGDVRIDDGIARTSNLEMKGVAAEVSMDGSADIRRETQDLKVVVVPEINAGTASLLATIVNPVVGLSTFVAQAVLRGPLIRATTQAFEITGRWDDPKIVKVTGGAAR